MTQLGTTVAWAGFSESLAPINEELFVLHTSQSQLEVFLLVLHDCRNLSSARLLGQAGSSVRSCAQAAFRSD